LWETWPTEGLLPEGEYRMEDHKQPQGRRTGWLKNNNPPCDLRSLPRCQAKAKSTGRQCGNAAMKGKRVCYIHGGRSPGAPKGNRNAWKTGCYDAETRREKEEIRKFLDDCRELLSGTSQS